MGGGGRQESSRGGSFRISMVTRISLTGEGAVNRIAFERRLLQRYVEGKSDQVSA